MDLQLHHGPKVGFRGLGIIDFELDKIQKKKIYIYIENCLRMYAIVNTKMRLSCSLPPALQIEQLVLRVQVFFWGDSLRILAFDLCPPKPQNQTNIPQ